jgi:hypothetical protein
MNLADLLNNDPPKKPALKPSEPPKFQIPDKNYTSSPPIVKQQLYNVVQRPTENRQKPQPFLQRPPIARSNSVSESSQTAQSRDDIIASEFCRNLSKLITEYATEEDYAAMNIRSENRGMMPVGIPFSAQSPIQPGQWSPKITIDSSIGSGTVVLSLHEAGTLKPGLSFILEHEYSLKQVMPRSYFATLHQFKYGHTFVFDWVSKSNLA